MRVHELIDILSDQPADAEVELAVIAPVDEGSDDITVDRYFVDGVLPWEDDDDDEDSDGELTIWLVGGEEADVNAFLDAIEQPDACHPQAGRVQHCSGRRRHPVARCVSGGAGGHRTHDRRIMSPLL